MIARHLTGRRAAAAILSILALLVLLIAVKNDYGLYEMTTIARVGAADRENA